MTTVQQVYEVMQRLAPPELAEHWDNPGLLVDCGGNVRRVLVTLDITPEVVAEAAAKQCTVIVAHHPVIFDPLKRLCPADVPYQLVQAGISAICMHTNLDAAEGGVNDVLADIFGIRQRTAFADGCGRVGDIDPITVPELAALAQRKLAALCNAPDTGTAVQVKFADAGKPVHRLSGICKLHLHRCAGVRCVAQGCQLTLRQCGQLRYGDGVDVPHPAAAVCKGGALPDAENIRQHIVHPALGGIQIGVHTDGGNARLHQLIGHIGGAQPLERVKDDRVVRHDDRALLCRSFCHHLRGDVQRHQHPAHIAAAVHQQARVIPVLCQLRRGKPLHYFVYLLYRGHFSFPLSEWHPSLRQADCRPARPAASVAALPAATRRSPRPPASGRCPPADIG